MKKNGANLFLLGIFGNQYGHSVSGAHFYLQTEPGQKLVAFQETGDSGSITFAHLDKGVYKIYLDLPQQAKKDEEADESNLQLGYHSKKRICLFQDSQSYYTLRYSNVEKLNNSNITPMYEQEKTEINPRLAIAKLEVTGKYGSLTLKLASLSQEKFQKLINKYKQDAGMAIINSETIPPPA